MIKFGGCKQKKKRLLLLICVCAFIFPGCGRADISFKVNMNKSVEVSGYLEVYEGYLPKCETALNAAKQELEEQGYLIEDINGREGQKGFQFKKNFENEKELSDSFKKLKVSGLIKSREPDSIPIKANRDLIYDIYSIKAGLRLTKNALATSGYSEMADVWENMKITVRVTMPVPAQKSNAKFEEEGGKTLYWEPEMGEYNAFSATAVIPNILKDIVMMICALFVGGLLIFIIKKAIRE